MRIVLISLVFLAFPAINGFINRPTHVNSAYPKHVTPTFRTILAYDPRSRIVSTERDSASHLFPDDILMLAQHEIAGRSTPEDGPMGRAEKQRDEMREASEYTDPELLAADEINDVPRIDWNPKVGDEILTVRDLHVRALDDNTRLIRGLDIDINCGECHAILGRNGSGKSTLSKTIMGYPNYSVNRGSIMYKGIEIAELDPHVRSHLGIFLSFQAPPEIGIGTETFLLEICNSKAKAHGEPLYTALTFAPLVKSMMRRVGLPMSYLDRGLNEGFSGGERKRAEMLQMLLLKPHLIILDETDSGLDVDSFKLAAETLRLFREEDPTRAFIVVTHYKRLLDVLKPDKCHVMHKGKVIHVGGAEVPDQLEKDGFQPFLAAYKKKVEAAAAAKMRPDKS